MQQPCKSQLNTTKQKGQSPPLFFWFLRTESSQPKIISLEATPRGSDTCRCKLCRLIRSPICSMSQIWTLLILTCLPTHLSCSSPLSLLFQLLLLCEGKNRAARSLCSDVCLTRGRMMLSPVHSILAGRRTSGSSSSSEAGRTWRRCKMEEAVARWMRHVSGCFHRTPHPLSPLLLFSLVLLSFTLPPPLLHLWAVAECLPPVSLSPSLHHRCSDYSAYSVRRPELLAPYVRPPLLFPFPCRLLLTLQVTKPLSSPLSPSPLLLSFLLSQLRFITPLSSPPSAPVSAPHSHTCAVFSHIHAHSHTLPLCLCASSCLLMHVACFACPPPISLSLSLSLSLSRSVPLFLSRCSLSLQHTLQCLCRQDHVF